MKRSSFQKAVALIACFIVLQYQTAGLLAATYSTINGTDSITRDKFGNLLSHTNSVSTTNNVYTTEGAFSSQNTSKVASVSEGNGAGKNGEVQKSQNSTDDGFSQALDGTKNFFSNYNNITYTPWKGLADGGHGEGGGTTRSSTGVTMGSSKSESAISLIAGQNKTTFTKTDDTTVKNNGDGSYALQTQTRTSIPQYSPITGNVIGGQQIDETYSATGDKNGADKETGVTYTQTTHKLASFGGQPQTTGDATVIGGGGPWLNFNNAQWQSLQNLMGKV